MTEAEIMADVLTALVNSIAQDMLTGRNSGVEKLYRVYVKSMTIDEGSY